MTVSRWWTRIWVIQEVVVPAKVTVIYDSALASWDMFVQAAKFYTRNQDLQSPSSFPMEYVKVIQRFARMILDIQSMRGSWTGENKTSLLSLLRQFSDRQASGDRDKVYALLGLAKDGKLLQPDYSIAVPAVYKRTALNIIKTSHSLTVMIGDLGRKNRQDLPSWVPDWSAAQDIRELRRAENTKIHHATGNGFAYLVEGMNNDDLDKFEYLRNLIVKGDMYENADRVESVLMSERSELRLIRRTIDQQKQVGGRNDPERYSNVIKRREEQMKHLKALTQYCVLEARRIRENAAGRFLKFSDIPELIEYFKEGQTNSGLQELILRFLLAGPQVGVLQQSHNGVLKASGLYEGTVAFTGDICHSDSPSDLVPVVQSWAILASRTLLIEPPKSAFWKVLCAEVSRQEITSDSTSYRRVTDQDREALAAWLFQGEEVPFGRKFMERSNESIDPLLFGNLPKLKSTVPSESVQNIDSAVRTATCRRSFFITTEGFMGLGPASTTPGDRIFTLIGAKTPFILRATAGSSSTWSPHKDFSYYDAMPSFQVIGDCHVHGLMHGESMMKWEKEVKIRLTSYWMDGSHSDADRIRELCVRIGNLEMEPHKLRRLYRKSTEVSAAAEIGSTQREIQNTQSAVQEIKRRRGAFPAYIYLV